MLLRPAMDNRIRLIVGRSGSGKDYLTKVFGLACPPSYTTRPMRSDDVDGFNHTFVSMEDYENTPKEDMAAYTLYHGHHYWTTFKMLENCSGYVIDPPGVEYLLKNFDRFPHGFIIILVTAPLWKRVKHMRERGTTWRLILSRIRNDRKAFRSFEKSGNYDYIIKM